MNDRRRHLRRVLFRVAAGPRLGFGHLVRAGRLARVLGVPEAAVSVRTGGPVGPVARRLGLAPASSSLARAFASSQPALVVVDDPDRRSGHRAVSFARRRGAVTVSVHDLGLAYAGADFGVDGTVAPGAGPGAVASLVGSRYAIIDPRAARRPLAVRRPYVLVALGGGTRTAIALALARAIRVRAPQVHVIVAAGFHRAADTDLPDGVRLVGVQDGLVGLLRRATLAVTAGGMTLYEAAACGTPVVATAVVDAQRPTLAGFAALGAAVDAGRLTRARVGAVATAAAALLADEARRQQMGRTARRVVDGRGARRVAAAIRGWMRLAAGRSR